MGQLRRWMKRHRTMMDSFLPLHRIDSHRGTHGLPACDGDNQGIDDDSQVG